MKRELGTESGEAGFLARTATAPIRAYSRFVSPGLPRRCKYEPTCSAYAIEAIERFGAIRGFLLAAWRLIRCNPFSHGGFDPVRDEFTFRVGPMDPAVYHGEVPATDRAEPDLEAAVRTRVKAGLESTR